MRARSVTSARTLAPALASCLSSRFLNQMQPIQSYMMRTSTPAARRSSRMGTISAVSRSCSQMKYCRWMKRCAPARSSLRRANLALPVTNSSTDAAGVEVRIMYDWMGCISFKKREFKQLAKAGATVRADVTDLARINYRNHRKIVVIDGEIGYTGGMNVGQEYIDGGERFATWRDTHMRLTGQAVGGLEKLYASRWFEHKKDHEDLFTEQYMPAPDPTAVETGTLVEIAAQEVEDPWSAARRAHMVAIGQAEKSVWIQSPYFVPDYSIYDVMINAALSGIDVRFMMTGVPDKRTPFYAAQTYYRKLIEAGGKVYLYEAGFFHSKTIVVDGIISAVGTMNMDQRSLKLHKELMCWVFDKDFAQQCADAFRADMENCHEVALDDVLTVRRLKRFRNQAARLFSDVL